MRRIEDVSQRFNITVAMVPPKFGVPWSLKAQVSSVPSTAAKACRHRLPPQLPEQPMVDLLCLGRLHGGCIRTRGAGGGPGTAAGSHTRSRVPPPRPPPPPRRPAAPWRVALRRVACCRPCPGLNTANLTQASSPFDFVALLLARASYISSVLGGWCTDGPGCKITTSPRPDSVGSWPFMAQHLPFDCQSATRMAGEFMS
jgi:hypothetical protein